MSTKPVLYSFSGSAWVQVPLLAIAEGGYADGAIAIKDVDLAAGANFDPAFLQINPRGTVPVLVDATGHTPHKYLDSTNATHELAKKAPRPPPSDSSTHHELKKFIELVHEANHDPNDLFILPVDEADRKAKAGGAVAGFLRGRQAALDKYAPDAPAEFKEFLQKKQQGNKQLLQFITGSPSAEESHAVFQKAREEWRSAGELLRGQAAHLLKKAGAGRFLGGDDPAEADFHFVTWLARIASNAGASPGAPAAEVLRLIEAKTDGREIPDVVGAYWDAWRQRPSFATVGLK